jgi:CBS domain containing-hemolysin-like protein
MTLAILILSEIIPKTLGANYWKQLTNFTVLSLDLIIKLLYPLVWVSQLITKSLKKDKNKSVLSRADFSAMAEIGEKTGVFKEDESKIIKNLLRFNTIRTKDVMTPRTVVIASNEEMTINEFYEKYRNALRFSRVPIFKEAKDQITGFFLKDELLQHIIDEKGDQALKSIKRDILIVNEQFPIPDLFTKFIETREHIALVVDEFGGMAGIATMEDVIETLLGLEIVDEMDNSEDMQDLARQRWEKRAKDLGLFQMINDAEKEDEKNHPKSE